MFTVCANCGQHRPDKIIDPSGPFAICPVCGHKHFFRRLPLMLVGGASAVGKTSVLQALVHNTPPVVLLDSDILWRPEFDQPETHYRDFFETWLCMCKNISQSGKPVVLFGAGFAVPDNLEPCIERRYFHSLHYLSLVCSEDVLVERLLARPEWRGCADPRFIEQQIAFNRWLKEYPPQATPAIQRIDTTNTPLSETSQQVAGWIGGVLSAYESR